MFKPRYLYLPLLAMFTLGLGCTSEGGRLRRPSGDGVTLDTVGDGKLPAQPSTSPSVPGVGSPPVPVDSTGLTADGICKPPAAPLAIRRLTSSEYDNTIRDLLGLSQGLASSFVADDDKLPYRTYAQGLTVTPLLAEQYSAAASKLAGEVKAQLATLAPCAANGNVQAETQCAESFIRDFGKRAYRRPITAEEVAKFSQLFGEARALTDYAGGVGFVAEVMLQSPYFVYKSEVGNGTGVDRVLTPFEVASQISYLVSGSMPDAELMAAADTNALGTPQQIEAQARRLMKAPRAVEHLRGFIQEWVGLRDITNTVSVIKDTTLFPTFDASLRAAMQQESSSFVDAVLTEGNGSLNTLFTANWSYVTEPLAQHYGTTVGGSMSPTRVMLPVAERAGLLTQAAFLTSQSKPGDSFPILRGKILRTRVLCGTLAPPPANLMIQAPQPSANLTTRERFAAHSQNPACSGCHRVIDPLGFGFENYDAVGGYRATENGKPIDASGAIVDLSAELDGPFTGAVEFAGKIARSQVLQACVTREFYRFANGRDVEGTETCALNTISKALSGNPDIRELVVSVARTEGFALRADR